MSGMDFNNAEPQRAGFDLIPEGAVVLLVAKLRPGGEGPGGWLRSSSTGCTMADFEFTVDGGEYDRRKLWALFVTDGVTDGHAKAASISRSRLRAMLESAHGIEPTDDSAPAMAKRQVDGWQVFDGLRFCAKIGKETGDLKNKMAGPQSERYPDKNTIKAVLTPDDADYISPGGAPAVSAGVVAKPAAANGAAKPAWAS